MAFYLRKSLRIGPVRLNLSKRGLGASIGVTGARVGLTPGGRAYIHAGRGGVYLREELGSGGATRPERDHPAPEPITLYEDTGVTYVPAAAAASGPEHAGIGGSGATTREEAVVGYLLFILVGLIVIGASLGDGSGANPVLLLAGLASASIGSVAAWRSRSRNRAQRTLRRALEAAVSDGRPLRADELASTRAALSDPYLTDAARVAVLRGSYLDAVRKIVDDGSVSPDEIRLLGQFEAEFSVDREECRTARADAFRGLYLRAAADHELSAEEERELAQVRVALGVSEAEAAVELEGIVRLREIRRIREGELPVVAPSKALRASETCHFEAPGRLLKEKNLRTFRRDGRKHRVRGLAIDKEGVVLITNERLLLVHSGTMSVPMDRILDVEVDVDRNLVRITKDGASTPVLLSMPDALRAGAIIAAARGL